LAYDPAAIAAGMGDRDQAIAWLNKACDDHAEWLNYANGGVPRVVEGWW